MNGNQRVDAALKGEWPDKKPVKKTIWIFKLNRK